MQTSWGWMGELRWEKFSDYLFVKKIIKILWKSKY